MARLTLKPNTTQTKFEKSAPQSHILVNLIEIENLFLEIDKINLIKARNAVFCVQNEDKHFLEKSLFSKLDLMYFVCKFKV